MYMMEKEMKDLAWNTFKQTGNINSFMEFKQVQNIEKNRLQNNTIEEKFIKEKNINKFINMQEK